MKRSMNLNYLRYVIRHKWFVFQECKHLGVSLWQAVVHDWQKFTPAEWTAYALSFYGPWGYEERPEWLVAAFDRAWLHHQHYGPHHWQHWILREDSGNTIAIEMPDRFVREMIADWAGAGRAITGKINICNWYSANREKMLLHPNTQAQVERYLEEYYGWRQAGGF